MASFVGNTGTSAWDAILKERFEDRPPADLFEVTSPFWMELKKRGDLGGGRHYRVPVRLGNPGGGSASFGTANSNATPSNFDEFLVKRAKDYNVVKIDGELMSSATNSKESFMESMDELQMGFRGEVQELAWSAYRTADGNRGQIDSSTSLGTNTLKLKRASDALGFQKGMKCVFAANKSSGSLRNSGTTNEVKSVDLEAGTVDFQDNLNANVTSISTGDYIYREGDRNNKVSGLLDWIPTDRTSSNLDGFFSVDRTDDPARLAGIHRSYNNEPLAETLIRLTSSITKYGGRPNRGYIHPDKYADLLVSLEARKLVHRETEVQTGSIGFNGVKVQVGNTNVTVLPDPFCPQNTLPVVDLGSWTVASAKQAPHFLRIEGSPILKFLDGEDVAQGRIGMYGNIACRAPLHNGVAEIESS